MTPKYRLSFPKIISVHSDDVIRTRLACISEAAKGTYADAHYKRILENNRRQLEQAERSQREFEQRKAAEVEAAKERDQ